MRHATVPAAWIPTRTPDGRCAGPGRRSARRAGVSRTTRRWGWSKRWSHSPQCGTARGRPPGTHPGWSRMAAAGREQRSALSGSVLGPPSRVRIAHPPPPLTRDDEDLLLSAAAAASTLLSHFLSHQAHDLVASYRLPSAGAGQTGKVTRVSSSETVHRWRNVLPSAMCRLPWSMFPRTAAAIRPGRAGTSQPGTQSQRR